MRGVMIDHDAESYPLEIKTDSKLGSRDEVRVWFHDADKKWTGTVRIFFTSPMQYYLYDCTKRADFPTVPPSAIEKIWTITLARSPDIRVQIQCNAVEVLNIMISDSTCKKGWKKEDWAKEKVKLMFSPDDKGSDDYIPSPGTNTFKNGTQYLMVLKFAKELRSRQ